MASIVWEKDAQNDMAALRLSDPVSWARILALFEQIKADQNLLSALTEQDYGAAQLQPFHITMWQEQQHRHRRNLWRLKIWDLEDCDVRYRVVYAFHPTSHRHHILGVVERAFDYKATHPITQRILAAYERLDIPAY